MRSLETALLALVAGTLGYAAVIRLAPPPVLIGVQFSVMLLVNGFAIRAILSRGAALPAERKGWRCFAAGIALVVIANGVMLAGALSHGLGVPLAWVDILMQTAGGLLQARGLLALPWKREYRESKSIHLLGALTFVASIVLLFWMLEIWQGGFRGSLAYTPSLVDLVRLGNTNVALRAIFIGGVAVFLISEHPKRAFGPGGLILFAALVSIVGVTGSAHFAPGGAGTPGGALWVTLGQTVPILYGLAAWSRRPLDPERSRMTSLSVPLNIALQYLPFVITGVFLARVDARNPNELAWSLLAFFAISGVIVLRQVILFRDVRRTNHRLVERVDERTRRLARTSELLEAIIDSTPSHIFALDRQHRFTLANRSLATAYGLEKEALLGGTLPDIFPPKLAAELWATNERIMQTGEPVSIEEVLQSRGGQRPRIVIASKFPLRDEFGVITGIAGVVTDVTDHRVSEAERSSLTAQLHQAQKMESVGRLAGGVAHDFNNMLGVILGHAELALRLTERSSPICADLVEIQNAAQRSTELTRQLLTFARQEIVRPRVLDLNGTVTNSLRMLQRMIGEDIHITWCPATRLWPIRMDPSQVDQILINLCVNARDAIADVGTITLETANVTIDAHHPATLAGARPGDYIVLSVEDNGSGIDADTLPHIFEPFYTTKPVGEGTGLGLATVYGAVTQNGGAVTVASERGEGTSFEVYLPRYVGDAVEETEERPSAPPARGRATILVVEDEPKILRLVGTVLESQGYTVLRAGTPSDALRQADEHDGPIHLLLTDVIMPGMNGRDLARKIGVTRPSLRPLYMSGYPAGVIASRDILDIGVQFVSKPFSIADLAAKIREVLDAA